MSLTHSHSSQLKTQTNGRVLSDADNFIAVCSLADAVHASVQPAGKAASSEMVRASVGQGEEENLPRPGSDHSRPEAQDVQLLGVERSQNSVQKVRDVNSSHSLRPCFHTTGDPQHGPAWTTYRSKSMNMY